ncbi:MAG: penicillin-insensitive murein endopeptidase [Alphaproteobacteria bacterium]|nr:penicillin-insensitive murein endopeptidase [Alphaproteobacteria bacterium]
MIVKIKRAECLRQRRAARSGVALAAGWRGFLVLLWAVAGCHLAALPALAQDTAAETAARRRAALAGLPADAAKRLFGLAEVPSTGPAQAIGGYARGCLAGARQLPADGAGWQVMRPSRNRAWGHPVLLATIERLAGTMPAVNGWPGLLIGDLGQPRGGPMLTGHESHQIGLDADIWLRPMPNRRLSVAEREEVSAIDVVRPDGLDIDPASWTPQHGRLLEAVSRDPAVARIFVNPAIKRALCREAAGDRAWLAKVRPWWGHDYHFHVRLTCPSGDPQCHDQPPPPAGDGCGHELDWWFTDEALHPKPGRPAKPLRLSDLPPACAAVLAAP